MFYGSWRGSNTLFPEQNMYVRGGSPERRYKLKKKRENHMFIDKNIAITKVNDRNSKYKKRSFKLKQTKFH